jgi:hypothetical protein
VAEFIATLGGGGDRYLANGAEPVTDPGFQGVG